MSKISGFLKKNFEMIIEKKYSKIYLKLKAIYEQLQDEFFNLNETEKITFGEVENFLREYEKKNGESTNLEGELSENIGDSEIEF